MEVLGEATWAKTVGIELREQLGKLYEKNRFEKTLRLCTLVMNPEIWYFTK